MQNALKHAMNLSQNYLQNFHHRCSFVLHKNNFEILLGLRDGGKGCRHESKYLFQ